MPEAHHESAAGVNAPRVRAPRGRGLTSGGGPRSHGRGMLALVLLALALGGTLAAWWLGRRVRDLERQGAEVRLLRRELGELRGEVLRGLAVTRGHLADVAGGQRPARDAIVRGLAWQDISPADALALYEQTPVLVVLDVRTPAEHAHGHIPDARLIPLDELEDRLGDLPPRDTTMLVHCAAGGRSAAACETLGRHGYTRLLNLVGGMHTWTGPRVSEGPAAPPPGVLEGTVVAYHGGPVSEAEVIGAIRECFDPEIPLNIYDLGLIYGVDIAEAAITVRMTLTSEGCPSARAIPEDVKKRVVALGQPNVQVEVVWDPPWHPSRISAEGKTKLGLA